MKTGEYNCGKFSVPGSDAVHSYAGVVEGETVIQIGPKLYARVANLRVIEHPHPFFLLGADILRGGRPEDSWNFRGLIVSTQGVGQVEAHLEFDQNGERIHVPLPHAPAGGAEPGNQAIAFVGSGGQCLRRNF